MGGHHSHHHHHHGADSGTRLLIALAITIGFAIAEVIGGLISGSLALLGDAGHMVTDSSALAIAAFASWLSRQPPSPRHSYGMLRAEVVAALFNGLFMVAVVMAIVLAAIERMQNPQPVSAGIVMVIAAIGLVVNMVVAFVLSHGEQDLNTRGALLHVIGDLLGSVAALASGAIIYFTGWLLVDPILSVLICVLILLSAFRLLREVLNVIMEGVPLHLDLKKVGMTMARAENVTSIHDLHIWTLSSGSIALSAHVVIDDMSDWQSVLSVLRELLHDQYAIDHVTLQPELAIIEEQTISLDSITTND